MKSRVRSSDLRLNFQKVKEHSLRADGACRIVAPPA